MESPEEVSLAALELLEVDLLSFVLFVEFREVGENLWLIAGRDFHRC
jgi:hypothetical protein